MLGQVYIKDMRLYAYHGVMEQERRVGNEYVVNVCVDYPLEKACETDDVNDTLNYSVLAHIVKQEMSQPSNLLEHVARRIADSVISSFPLTEAVTIDIKKVAPPIAADMDGAGIRIQIQNS